MALRILIAYASAGTGHRRAAEAIYNYLRTNYKELDVHIVDVLDYTNFLFKNIYSRGYAFIITRLPFLWSLVYQFTYANNLKKLNQNVKYFINRLNTKEFQQFLLGYNPHIIVATHFLPSTVVGYLKKNNKINSRLINIITDFNVHPFWIADGVDEYIAGLEVTKSELKQKGVNEDKIKVFGIPVDLKFSRSLDKKLLYKKFTLQEDKFTVLIVTAAFGLGPIEKIVDLLYRDVQVLVVCGRNYKLYRKLKKRDYKSTKIFGFVDNIEELMRVCDVIITKPGGLTSAESLAMGLPMVFISAIYGQESKNAQILEDYDVGVSPDSLIAIRDTILNYKNNQDRLNSIREKINKIKKPYAVKEICAWLLPK